MEDLEIISEELLTELFNMGSAKGYPYTVSAPGEYPADPAITFQAVFTDDHGTEFAFRVYKANLIQGSGQRKYGKNTRVLAFMRRKTKNFAQNITVDSGTFKKVLVTFMQCYTEYKDSKDGPLASSYAIILQASLKPYATLFVRATARAFKSNRKLHLSLYGVNEDGTNGSIELLYVNPQTIYPYWGGPEFDEAKFVGNPTHVKLSKLEGHEVKPAVSGQVTPVSVAADPNAGSAQQASATSVNAPAANLPDPMDNPAAFNDDLFARLHYAKGRDDFANILRDVRVHRQYMQQHFDTLFNELYVGKPLDALFDKVVLDQWREGMGFYLKRYDPVAYAYIVVYVTNSKSAVEDLSGEMSKVSSEVGTLKAQAGNVSTGGSISKLFEAMSNRINKAASELLLDAKPNDFENVINQAYSTVQVAIGEGIAASGSFSPFITNQASGYSNKDVAKLMVTGYYAGLLNNVVLVQDIGAYVPSDASITRKGTLVFTQYDDWFDQSTALIDALAKKYVNKTSVTFGSSDTPELMLAKLFMAGDFASMKSAAPIKRLIDETQLTRYVVDFLKTAPLDFVNAHVQEIFSNMAEIPTYYNFNYAMLEAMANRVGSIPGTESLSDDNVNYMLSVLEWDSTSELSVGCINYFRRHQEPFFNWFTDNPGKVMYGSSKKITPTTIDVDSYVNRVIKAFDDDPSKFYVFAENMFAQVFGPLLTTEHILNMISANLINDDSTKIIDKYSPAMREALIVIDVSVDEFLDKFGQDADALIDHKDTIKALFDAATTAEQDALVVRLQGAIDRGLYSEFVYVFGPDALNEYVSSKPDSFVRNILSDGWGNMMKWFDASTLNLVFDAVLTSGQRIYSPSSIVDGLDGSKQWDNISINNLKGLFNRINTYDRSVAPSSRADSEMAVSRLLVEIWTKDQADGEAMFNALPIEERKLVAKAIHAKSFVLSTKNDLAGDNVPIKPLVDLTPERINQILKYNDIKVPRTPQVRDNTTMGELMTKGVVPVPINKLAVTEDVKTEQELEEMSIEYDTFNRYKHGNIAVKMLRSFSVNIPVQEKGFADWVAKMNAEGTDPQIMRPMFHGTGSIAASMILRYGFKVINANDSSVVGRMLGDGIYFSNVLDKVSQYMSDGGYSRGAGVKGYIFEMEVSLGMFQRDFRAAGPGTGYDQNRVISPEWAVFNANEQTRIYKAYECVLIDKYQMDKLKSKHGINENTSVVGIKHFTNFINEAGPGGKMKNAVVFIFMDGTIPVSKTKAVDFEDFDASKFGKHVQLDWSGSGPTVQIATNGPGGVYCVRFTKAMMHDRAKIEQFLDYLNGKA